MDTKVKYALNWLRNGIKLTEREQRSLINQMAFDLGIRMHARAHARPGACDILTDDDDGDNESAIAQKLEKESYQHKINLVMQIIDKYEKNNEKPHGVYDILGCTKQLKKLVTILTYGQLGRLNFYGLCRMIRVAQQASDATNPTAYILTSYKNLVDGKNYKRLWAKEQEAERNREFVAGLANATNNEEIEF